jgi:hypothetical protein
MQCRNFCFDAFEYRDDLKLNALVNFLKGISGTTSRVQELKDGGSHNRRAFPLLCPGYFPVYYSVHIRSHLTNNQQQGCMDSLLATGRGRRCYDDRSMWEPEWSELTKGRGRLHMVIRWVCLRRSAKLVKCRAATPGVSARQTYEGKPIQETDCRKPDELTRHVN